MRVEARVIRIHAQQTFVRVGPQAGCGRCDEAGGCRSDMLGQIFGSRCREYEVENLADAKPGHEVIVEIADGAALRAALLAYVLPLSLLFAGATLGWCVSGSESSVIVGSVLGLVCSILLLWGMRRRLSAGRMRPRLVEILEPK
jgi:sigma-E factor negative regulatory protein RseC